MAQKLGSPQTTKFSIGTAELRIGRLEDALKLQQVHSIGLIDNATVEVAQESVDLQGGFPKVLVDTAVVEQTASLTSTLREYSRRNLQLMLGEGVVASGSEPADLETDVTAPASAGGSSLTVADETGFATDDVIVIYEGGDQANVTISKVATTSANTITLDADLPLLDDITANAVVFLANEVTIGGILETNYFSLELLQLERASARPIGFAFWKGAIGAGLTFATNAEDFASTELNVKLLQPAASEYAGASDPLYDVRDLIPLHPTGMYFGGGDT